MRSPDELKAINEREAIRELSIRDNRLDQILTNQRTILEKLEEIYRRLEQAEKRSRAKQPPVLDEVWRNTLSTILFGHANYRLFTGQQWGTVKAIAKKMIELGITPDEVEQWHVNRWLADWPGKDGRRPSAVQLLGGVATWIEREPEPEETVVFLDE